MKKITNKEVGKKIKELREKKFWSLQDLTDRLALKGFKMNPSSIHRIEEGEREKIDVFMLDKLSEIFNYNLLFMVSGKVEEKKEDRTLELKEKSNVYEIENNIPKFVTLPVYGMASAGTGALDYDVVMEEFILPADFEIPKDSFIIGVYGESMEPIFYDGDRIMVDTSKRGTEWQFLVDYPVVVQINEERFVKVVKFNNYKPEFHSLNQMYTPITVTNGDEIILVGVVTEILKRKIGKIKL